MKSYRKELFFEVPSRRGLVNITPEVEAALAESGIREGLVLVNAMNITASVFINDDEPGLHQDYEAWLERLAPKSPIANTIITAMRTMPMPTLNAQLWVVRPSWP